LRGGRRSWRGDDTVEIRFDRARFAADVALSGSATWERASGPARAQLRPAGSSDGRLRASWSMQRPLARARLDRKFSTRRLRAVMLAP